MEILAHRGIWTYQHEKNTVNALITALNEGFGIETDVRDYNGKIVISHDIPQNDSPDLIELLSKGSALSAYFALNVKSDGLCLKIKSLLNKYDLENYFVFDMSVPEMVQYRANGLNYFTRHSDIEECVLYEDAIGVWIDNFFEENWNPMGMIEKHLDDGKIIGVISPELHGKDHECLWELIKDQALSKDSRLLLCTDKPREAKEYFGL